jgi:hypothetical protein
MTPFVGSVQITRFDGNLGFHDLILFQRRERREQVVTDLRASGLNLLGVEIAATIPVARFSTSGNIVQICVTLLRHG